MRSTALRPTTKMSAVTTSTSASLDFERQRRYNMDILLAAAEALRRAEVNECYSRAGKIQKVHVKRKRGVFKCEKCPSVFGLRHNLLRHDRTIHQGRRPFKCDQASCNASFVQRFDLETHRSSVHDKRKDYQCDQCDRTFSQRSNLHTHVKITHDAQSVDSLRCETCSKSFKSKSRLRQHVTVHNTDTEKSSRNTNCTSTKSADADKQLTDLHHFSDVSSPSTTN